MRKEDCVSNTLTLVNMTNPSVLFHLQLERKLKRGSQSLPPVLFTSHFAGLPRGFLPFLISGIIWTLIFFHAKLTSCLLFIWTERKEKQQKQREHFLFQKKFHFLSSSFVLRLNHHVIEEKQLHPLVSLCDLNRVCLQHKSYLCNWNVSNADTSTSQTPCCIASLTALLWLIIVMLSISTVATEHNNFAFSNKQKVWQRRVILHRLWKSWGVLLGLRW